MATPQLSIEFASDPRSVEVDKLTTTMVWHPHVLQCRERIRKAMRLPEGHDILLVVGPTRVGKTTLLSAVLKDNPPALNGDMPVICVTAHRGASFKSCFADLLRNILRVLNAPLTEYGKASDPSDQRPSFHGAALERASLAELQSMVTEALRQRNVRLILIDEAQHLSPVSPSAAYSTMMADSLKDLGSHAHTVVVLFGMYDLLSLYSISGQLGCRSEPAHFAAYDLSSEGQANFRKVVRSLCAHAPTLLPFPELEPSLDLLYAGCLGCTGLLSKWFVKAAGEVLGTKRPCVTRDILEATMRPRENLLTVRAEIAAGLEHFGRLYSPVADYVKLVYSEVLAPAAQSSPQGESGDSASKPRRPPPGRRAPTRDSVHPVQPVQV